MKAEMIFTGTELLLGQTLNTHAQYLGRNLSNLGIDVTLHTTVGDDWDRMALIFRQALERSDIIITTGGLGPTSDDLTKETVAEVLGLPMVLHEESLASIKQYFLVRNNKMPDSNIKQAYFPRGAEVLPNPCGTAPGAIIKTENNKIVIILPGPPWELEAIYENSVAPYLASLPVRGDVTRFTIFKLTGIREDNVQDLLSDLDGVSNPEIAYIARPGEVHVRVSAHAKTSAEADKLVKPLAEEIKKRLSPYIFATDDEKIELVVGDLLKKKGMTIAVAESCTAGLVESRLCDIAGCSNYLKGGVVCYSRMAKEKILGIDHQGLEKYGAVSEWAAVAMAESVRKLLDADLGLAVTGVAGPASSENKPIGLVYIALATPEGTQCRKYKMPGRRTAIRQGGVNASLKMVRHYLQGK
ncbi:nicotinamide-nucleotide amidase [Desulfohalotomaculum tongense]|uniref:competence/damage-inducible protein A n=1 Tax=Desulforadius tongensis TaxID=1216062 RepID=UPI00195BFC23|nr:competence/damage-inducible protein A [Desulforadius tongensis]MBM7854474.1 nicotinamide-nucleotide amidase [Desulforadius tongensis]